MIGIYTYNTRTLYVYMYIRCEKEGGEGGFRLFLNGLLTVVQYRCSKY